MGASKADREKQVEIEFLYLDLDVCTRCKGTDDNLETEICALEPCEGIDEVAADGETENTQCPGHGESFAPSYHHAFTIIHE